jgi:hypothetical protein
VIFNNSSNYIFFWQLNFWSNNRKSIKSTNSFQYAILGRAARLNFTGAFIPWHLLQRISISTIIYPNLIAPTQPSPFQKHIYLFTHSPVEMYFILSVCVLSKHWLIKTESRWSSKQKGAREQTPSSQRLLCAPIWCHATQPLQMHLCAREGAERKI